MNAFRKILAFLMVLSWGFFVFLDYHFQGVVSQAVMDQSGTYGEFYGPLAFFRAVLLIVSLILTAIAAFVLYANSRTAQETGDSKQG